MDMPPGFVPATLPSVPSTPVVTTPAAGLDAPPPPPAEDHRRKTKVIEPKSKSLRVYYVGAILVGYVEQWFAPDGGPGGMYMATMDGSGPIKSVEEADRSIIEKLRGTPRDPPFSTTEQLQGYRICFHAVPDDVTINALPLAPPTPPPPPERPVVGQPICGRTATVCSDRPVVPPLLSPLELACINPDRIIALLPPALPAPLPPLTHGYQPSEDDVF